MSYDAKILADSISPEGVRLTTVQATFPRFILAEVNTHRVLSRNSASSRAIPTEKLIERVVQSPFIPATFNQRVKGMGVGEAFDEELAARATHFWARAIQWAVSSAVDLKDINLDKSRANRVLEPFMWHTAIITATEWSNFYALRDHEDAQGEFQVIAHMIRELMDASDPRYLREGEWHLPLVSEDEMESVSDGSDLDPMREDGLWWPKTSSGRCARVSFDTHENFEVSEKSYERANTLGGKGHWSPHEHPARPMARGDIFDDVLSEKILVPATVVRRLAEGENPTTVGLPLSEMWCGNFRGWVQLRKLFATEHDFGATMAAQA